MATEYKFPYSASEINKKLKTVDEIENSLQNNYYTSANIDTKLEEVNASIEDVGGLLETKADLDENGKIPTSQLPDDIGGGGLPEVSESDNGKFLCVDNGVWSAKSMFEWTGGSY